ncbi:MAG: hypothetical protein ABI299_02690 [Rhodanobacter sp.]
MMSKSGLAFCAAYLLVIAACLGLALSAGGDFKGQYVLLQLPIALQISAAFELGLGPALKGLSWPSAYVFLAGPTFLALYGWGWLITVARAKFWPMRAR